MADFKMIDEATLAKAAVCRERSLAIPRAVSARFDKRRQRIVIGLDTGIEFAFDPKLVKGLGEAVGDDFVGVRLEGIGSRLHFPRLDADFTVSRLIEGFVGPMDWAKRERRARASRDNGRQGGRPPKAAATG